MYLQFEDSLYHKNIPKYAAHILKNQQFPTHVIPKSEKDSHLYVIIDRPQPKEPMSIYEYKFRSFLVRKPKDKEAIPERFSNPV